LAFYYDGLIEAKEDVHSETPIRASLFKKIADVYAEKGEEQEAERCLKLAMDLYSRDTFLDYIDDMIGVYYTWGKIHLDYGRAHLAAKFFRPVVELDMLLYGQEAKNRVGYQSLKEASEALQDKKDLEAVKTKFNSSEEKETKLNEEKLGSEVKKVKEKAEWAVDI